MQVERLLEVAPEVLIRAILHRRERLAEMIPKQLNARKDEKETAEALARDAKQRRDLQKSELEAFSNKLKSFDEGTSEHQELLVQREQFMENAEKSEHEYLENELFRRRSDSRTKRLTMALNDCQRSIEYWELVLEQGFDHLLSDARRVKEGGKSSYALARQRKTNGGSHHES